MRYTVSILSVLLLVACDRGPEVATSAEKAPPTKTKVAEAPPTPAKENTQKARVAPNRRPPTTVDKDAPKLAGIAWKTSKPLTWRRPSSPMRNAEYAVDGSSSAVMTVFHFPGMGGDVKANTDRWVGQFKKPKGKPVVEKTQIAGLDITTIDVSGTFESSMPMGSRGGPQKDQRLLGAIVEGPQGLVFFKLMGPSADVKTAEKAFADLVGSMTPQ